MTRDYPDDDYERGLRDATDAMLTRLIEAFDAADVATAYASPSARLRGMHAKATIGRVVRLLHASCVVEPADVAEAAYRVGLSLDDARLLGVEISEICANPRA